MSGGIDSPMVLHLHLVHLEDAFSQSNLEPFIHIDTEESTLQV